VIFTKLQSKGWKAVCIILAIFFTFVAHGLLPNLILAALAGIIVLNEQWSSRLRSSRSQS
jgi:hypothetical protein